MEAWGMEACAEIGRDVNMAVVITLAVINNRGHDSPEAR